MKKTIYVDVPINPYEIADAIWEEFDAKQQALFLIRLAGIFQNERYGVDTQMMAAASEIAENHRDNVLSVIDFLHAMMQWVQIKARGDNHD